MVTDGGRSRPTQWAMPTPTPLVKPNAKQTNVGGDFPHLFDISSGGARVLVFTDKEQDTPEVVAVMAVTITNAAVTVRDKLRLRVSPVMVGQASRVPSTIQTPIFPRLRERSRVLMAPANWFIRAAGTMSWSRPRPATRFPEAGKALRL